MTDILRSAKDILEMEHCTCVIVKEDKAYTSMERGVKPLLSWLEENIDFKSASAADKVVGKAAAYIYVKMQISEVLVPVFH